MQNSDDLKSKFSTKMILLPVLICLFIFAYEDFLNNVAIQPIIYFLKISGIFTIPKSGNGYITFVLLLNLILNFAALFLIYFVFTKRQIFCKQTENKQYGFLTVIKVFIALFTVVTGFGFLVLVIQKTYFPNIPTTSPYDQIFPQDSSYSYYNLIIVIMLVCIFAPILEETVFRRMLIPFLEGSQNISSSYAVIISASVFAFIHSQADLLDGSIYFAIVHFASAFILGLGLASIYIATRNIKYSIFYHSLNNTLAILDTIIIAYGGVNTDNPSEAVLIFGLTIIIIILSGIGLLLYYIFNLKKVYYPLINQFKSKISLYQMILSLFIVLLVQGLIFIFIPYLEILFLDNFISDLTIRVIINAGMYIFIILFFILMIRREFNIILKQSTLSNPPLAPYEQIMHQNFYSNQFYNSNFGNQYPPPNQQYQSYNQNPNINPINYQNIPQQPLNQQPITCPNCKSVIPTQNVRFCPFCGSEVKSQM